MLVNISRKVFESSRSQVLFKIGVLKNFAISQETRLLEFVLDKVSLQFFLIFKPRGVFRTLSNMYDETFSKNSEWLKVIHSLLYMFHMVLNMKPV